MVDLGGYIIILMNDNGKIKLYGSSADNADNPEVGDEILEVNGRTLENATDAEVSQYIHQCIKSGTISLQVTRRTGNKMKELDGPNADRIRDAWVIALERGARERLQKLPALRKIQPRDIQAILHQQITDGSASTSVDETPKKDVTNSHITVTLAESTNRNTPAKLSNGTVPKGVAKEEEDSKDRKDILEKQRSCPEEANLLQPVPASRSVSRRASSPFQNGRTEVLIGEPEGAPRSPRGSTSSANNDVNLLTPGDPDYPESIYKSRSRSGSGVGDIHLQPSQLQDNNNGVVVSREIVKGGVVDNRDARVDITSGPNEMWAPGSSPGHNRELPVDVPDSLLQQAYANKQVMSLMLNRNETSLSSSAGEQATSRISGRGANSDDSEKGNSFGKRSASEHDKPDNSHHHHHHHNHHQYHPQQHQHHYQQHHSHHNTHPHNHETRPQSNIPWLSAKKTSGLDTKSPPENSTRDTVDNVRCSVIDARDRNDNEAEKFGRIIELSVKNEDKKGDKTCEESRGKVPNKMAAAEAAAEDGRGLHKMAADAERKIEINLDVIRPFVVTEEKEESRLTEEEDSGKCSLKNSVRNGGAPPSAILMTKESSVDVDEDYPFAKEDYPTMLKTCSDESASPRSSSGRSDSTVPMDASLTLTGKESPLYDARRIDLGSPCRSLVTDMKLAPLFRRETTSFDNPAYGLATDLHDLHQGLLMRSDEVNDLTRLISDEHIGAVKKASSGNKSWKETQQSANRQPIEITANSGSTRSKKKSSRRADLERARSRGNRDSDAEIDSEGLLGAGSTDDLLSTEITNLTITRSNRRKKGQQIHSSSGYSTLRSDASIAEYRDLQIDRSFLVVGNRSYREVAVDCPADFVPVTKSHPVYPPPGKNDTIERNLQTKRSHDDRTKKSATLPAERAAAIDCTDRPATTKDHGTIARISHCEDPQTDISRTDESQPLKSNDVRSIVCDLGGNASRDKPGLNGVKPAIPPRDQKRAPARPPKDNVRLSTRNNNIEQTDNANTPEPTQQELHSIRKYKEQWRKRKEEDERQEHLNRSMRDSKKLQALESHTTTLPGQENPAYAQDEVTSTTPRSSHTAPGQTTPREVEEAPKVLTYGEVLATLERLQLQLRNLSGALGISGPGVEAELEAVRTLLLQRRFATALTTHQVLRSRLRNGKVLKHHDDDASNLARDCVEVLENWQTTEVGSGETRAMVEELTGLLTSYEIEGLLLAHDSIVSYVDGMQRKTSSGSSSPSRSPSPSSSSLRGSRTAENIKIIRIEKTNEPLGATVRNEGDAVIIGRVVRGGAADKSGLFHEGDEVLEVNGVEMRGKSVNEVCDILGGMQGGLTFLVLPVSNNHRNNVNNTRREDGAQIQHVRAHFDYDPEEDPYIPCRELGVSFQKGDVLHVISQEDSNWWQAYREGEEDHTLAGLIPSRAFQHQRESVKQTITGGKSTIQGSKKSSTLLCTRKNPKKKKKRTKFGPNFNDEGYPLYSTSSIDDYDSEEVLTYEEVALYYPRADHKRPIVLIGPPNIGRHELRQRLMQDSERFAAAIPHTSRPRKGSEVDGQDYHFISRSQFESDILGRKFVEHGEYEKAYYGTSVEAIRTVVNSGKICVLNLHPQSLKILRSSDLKPYVVFVAPPSLEKLRQKRIKNNENFKEEELKDIIEKAREMEDKYGHLFDMIILNNDTDRAYSQLLVEINSLEREPQWVPASWVQ